MRNCKIDDISDDKHKELEEEEDMISVNERFNTDRSKYVLFPDSLFRTIWDMISFALIMY